MKLRIQKKTVQVVTSFILALFLVIPAFAYTNPDIDDTLLRVGMYYGSSALAAANLENVSSHGSGYQFGYFDNNLTFVGLAFTDQTEISILKTHNIYLTSSNEYTTSPTS